MAVSLCVLTGCGELLGLFIALDPQSTYIYRVQSSFGIHWIGL
jgi:hypothetical protein